MRRDITFFRFTLTVLTMITLSSCAKTSTVGSTEDLMPMRFGVAGISTRAVINGANDLQQNGQAFQVWGTYAKTVGSGTSGQNFTVFDGTKVTFNGAEWTYGDPQYWFPGFTYTFRALYPSDVANVTSGKDNFKIENFDATLGTDLLLAAPEPISCGVDQKMEKVALRFGHLLSRIAFVGRSDEKHLGKGRHIIIDEARLYGLHTTGNWSGVTVEAGTWTTGSVITNAGTTPYVISKTTYPDGLPLTPEGVSLFANELFIPQQLNNCVLTITFHYNVGEPKSFTREVRLADVSTQWEAGKSYRYPFTIDEHIFFETPLLVPWEYAPVHNTDFNIDHLQD